MEYVGAFVNILFFIVIPVALASYAFWSIRLKEGGAYEENL